MLPNSHCTLHAQKYSDRFVGSEPLCLCSCRSNGQAHGAFIFGKFSFCAQSGSANTSSSCVDHKKILHPRYEKKRGLRWNAIFGVCGRPKHCIGVVFAVASFCIVSSAPVPVYKYIQTIYQRCRFLSKLSRERCLCSFSCMRLFW